VPGRTSTEWGSNDYYVRIVKRLGVMNFLISFALLMVLSETTCSGQSNDVFSFVTTSTRPLSGYRVAVVSVAPIWMFGSGKNGIGIEKCSYWTDSAGCGIPWPASRVRQPGDRQHRYTRFRFGRVSVSAPLPPMGLALLVGGLVVVFGAVRVLRLYARRGANELRTERP